MPLDPLDSPDNVASPADAPSSENALVPVRHRDDGWTPARQRAFLEALADTGSVTAAAQAVGMTTVSAHRLRRRADARAFDAAWEAALERAIQLLFPAALDRAINGTVRQRWYHGEMIAEERVYSDRLLLRLLERGRDILGHGPARRAIRDDWEGAMAGIEAGAREPPLPDPDYQVVQTPEGDYITNCPPPPDHDGPTSGWPGMPGYMRRVAREELSAWQNKHRSAPLAQETERRRFFGLDAPAASMAGAGAPPRRSRRRARPARDA